VAYDFQVFDKAQAAKISLQGKYLRKAELILKTFFDKKVFYQYS